MRWLTKHVGSSHLAHGTRPMLKVEVNKILIIRPNHRLGNLLLMTPLLQEIKEIFPEAKIDLFIKGDLGTSIFKNYDNIDQIIQLPKKPFNNLPEYLYRWTMIRKNCYDLVINVIKDSSSGRLSTRLANAKYKFFGDLDKSIRLKFRDSTHNAKFPVYGLRNFLSLLDHFSDERQVPYLNLKLSTSEINEGKKILRDLVKNEKKTICLFTNATGAKLYSSRWWEEFYSGIITEFPDYNIIEVLPVENTSQINFKALTYSNKDIRLIGSFIANAAIFVAADSGMMHLGSAVQTSTVGLFKVTNLESYQPYGNKSVAIDTNTNEIDSCIKTLKHVLNS